MRRPVLSLAILASTASLALADHAAAEPAQEAASAMGACLAAVIDKAPVVSMRGQEVEIRRDTTPNICTVQVDAGVPREVRAAVMAAIAKRDEHFAPARTHWDPGQMESREAFCNAAFVKRYLSILVDTAKPGAPGPSLVATVMESPARDARCDSDLGLQRAPAAARTAPSAGK